MFMPIFHLAFWYLSSQRNPAFWYLSSQRNSLSQHTTAGRSADQ